VQQTSSYTVMQATTINGAYNAVADTLPGVLFPIVTKVGNTEVVSFQAGSFVNLLGASGSADQLQIAAGLDAARGAHYNDLLPLYQAIDPLSGLNDTERAPSVLAKGFASAASSSRR
jgi:hypothetical protein